MNDYDSNVRPHFKKLADEISGARRGRVSLKEFKIMTMNSWEREWILPYLGDEVLVFILSNMLGNCPSPRSLLRPSVTYEESVIGCLVPELLSRFTPKD